MAQAAFLTLHHGREKVLGRGNKRGHPALGPSSACVHARGGAGSRVPKGKTVQALLTGISVTHTRHRNSGLSLGTCSNGFDLISSQQVSPLGSGKGLQKPQLPLGQRAVQDWTRHRHRRFGPPRASHRGYTPAPLPSPSLPVWCALINGCPGLW